MTIIDEIRTERRHGDALRRAQLERIDQRFDQFDRRFDQVGQRFDLLERRLDRVGDRMGALEAKLGDVKADLMKWSFVFWVGAVGAIAALAGVLD